MRIKKDYIYTFKGIDQSRRRLPFIYAESGVEGPFVFLTAAIHGNEVTGTAVIHSIFKKFEKSPLLKGKIFAFPILNPTGFEAITRYETFTDEDLNRMFDSKYPNSFAAFYASVILDFIMEKSPDMVIDLHTDSINSVAYTIVDNPTSLTNKSVLYESIELAKNLNLPWAIDTLDTAGFEPEKCLTGQLIKKGIKAVTIELGGPWIVSEEFKKIGLESIWNYLHDLRMVGEKIDSTLKTQDKMLSFYERLRATTTGIIEFRVKPGDKIRKGQILGKVRNVFGETIETIYSPTDGILFSHEDQSVVFPGENLFTLVTQTTEKI